MTTTQAPITTTAAASARAAVKIYGDGENAIHALDGVEVEFERGRFTAIMGPSGSGKSTLMHCVAGLDTLTSGEAWIGDRNLSELSDRELTELRRDEVGFVFQAFNLLPTLSTRENIALPTMLAGGKLDVGWVDEVVGTLGLGDRLTHRPSELSGGQQQRVAVARALATRPQVMFADEPTGNLDSHVSAEILALLRRAVDDLGQTVVMVTHDPGAAGHADRVLMLADGRIANDLSQPTHNQILEVLR